MKKVLSIILCAVIAVSCMSFLVSAKAVKVKAPKIKSVTNTDIDRQKIKWTKVSGVKGYQLYCKKGSGKYKKIKTLGKNTTSFTNKKAKAGTKYFYKIRAYKKVSGKTKYSKFSSQLGKKCTNYLVDLYSPYSNWYWELYNNGKTFKMGGDAFTNGFTWSYLSESYTIFNLKGKYKYISFVAGEKEDNINRGDVGAEFVILSDDSNIGTYNIPINSLPMNFKIDIENANKLEFRGVKGYQIGLANIKLYK